MSIAEDLLSRSRNDPRDHDMKPYGDLLIQIASECGIIVELGVRQGMSTAYMLYGLGKSPAEFKQMISVDLENFQMKDEFKDMGRELGVQWSFIQSDSRLLEFEGCDMLFVDTLHNYYTADMELYLHGNKSAKYIVFHDTNGYTAKFPRDFDDTPGYWVAILKFLMFNPEWKLVKEYKDSQWGLTVLKRIE